MRVSRSAVALAVAGGMCLAAAVVAAVRLVPPAQPVTPATAPVVASMPATVPAPASQHTPPSAASFLPLASLSPLRTGQGSALDGLVPSAASQSLARGATAGTVLPASTRSDALPPPLFVPPPGQRPLVAIVIDDMGPNASETARALRLPPPITFAFLPYSRSVATSAAKAKAAGHELIVHVPMQPLDARQNPGAQALLVGLPAAELQRRLAWNLSQFSGFIGINNHMGSRFTADGDGMNVVMATLAERQLFFLDSRTIGRTAARAAAARHGVPLLERDVFLDDTDSAAAIAAQLEATLRVARKRGKAIAIGHPRPLTLTALERWLPTLAARGYELAPLSRILAHTTQPVARAEAADAAR